MSAPIPLIHRTTPAQNAGIHTSVGNFASYVQADGNRSMSSAQAGPEPGALMGKKFSVSFPNLKKADPPSFSHRHSHPECPVRPPSLSIWSKLSRPYSPCPEGEGPQFCPEWKISVHSQIS